MFPSLDTAHGAESYMLVAKCGGPKVSGFYM